MFKIGTVCLKIAGRDANNLCVIVEEPKNGKALVEGSVRRKAVNLKHLEPTGKTVKVKKGADHAAVMKELGLPVRESKAKQTGAKPARKKTEKKTEKKTSPRRVKKAEKSAKKTAKKTAKKADKK